MVPSITTSFGITLYWLPPWIFPMVSTSGFVAFNSRVVIAWRAITMCAAIFTGSIPFSGVEPWQPLPFTLITNLSKAAMQQPGVTTTVPVGIALSIMVPIWVPNTASAPSTPPFSIITSAPLDCSSEVWNIRRTVPAISSL